MAKKHIGMSNAERCRNYRKRIKAKKDLIEEQLDQHIKELKNKENKEKTENKGIKIDSLDAGWLEPQDKLREQFQQTEPEHYDFWGNKEGLDNPLDHVSHQQNLRNIFGESHSE